MRYCSTLLKAFLTSSFPTSLYVTDSHYVIDGVLESKAGKKWRIHHEVERLHRKESAAQHVAQLPLKM